MKPARLPLLIIIISLIGLLLYINFIESNSISNNVASTPTKVFVQKVAKKTFKDIVQALGTTKANEAVTLYSESDARVKSIHFNGGDTVKKGQVLLTLASDEEQAEIKELKANLVEAERKLTRFYNLHKANSASQSVVDQQDAVTDAIKAQLEQAQAKLNKFTIKAPFNGILGARDISVGTYLSTDTTITTLDDLSVIKVDFTLPERDLTKIHIGQAIEATNIAYGDVEFKGIVANIDSRLDPITRSISVRAHIKNTDNKLKPGMLLNILLLRSVEEVILIDESALIPKEDKQWVYVIEDKIAKKIPVIIGRRRPGIVEIRSGLTIGQTVVIEGALKIRSGSEVAATYREHQSTTSAQLGE